MTENRTVHRSGDLYIVQQGDVGRLIRPDQPPGEARPLGALLRMVSVDEPWEKVRDGEELPDAVWEVADAADGWTLAKEFRP